MSTFGVYVALCLPRSTIAIREARRPSVWPVASITNHSRCASPASLVSHELLCVIVDVMGVFLEGGIVYKAAKRLSSDAGQRSLRLRSVTGGCDTTGACRESGSFSS